MVDFLNLAKWLIVFALIVAAIAGIVAYADQIKAVGTTALGHLGDEYQVVGAVNTGSGGIESPANTGIAMFLEPFQPYLKPVLVLMGVGLLLYLGSIALGFVFRGLS